MKSQIRVLYSYSISLDSSRLRKSWNRYWDNLRGGLDPVGTDSLPGNSGIQPGTGWTLERETSWFGTMGESRFLTAEAAGIFGDGVDPELQGMVKFRVSKTKGHDGVPMATIQTLQNLHLQVFPPDKKPEALNEEARGCFASPSRPDWQELPQSGKVKFLDLNLWLAENGLVYLAIDFGFNGTIAQVRDLTYRLSFPDKRDFITGLVESGSKPREPMHPEPDCLRFYPLEMEGRDSFPSLVLEQLGFSILKVLQPGRSLVQVYHFVEAGSEESQDPWIRTSGFAGRFLPSKADPYTVEDDQYFDSIRFNQDILCHTSSEGVVAIGVGKDGSLTSQFGPRFLGQYFYLLLLAHHQSFSLSQLVGNLGRGRRSKDRSRGLFWDVLYEDYVDFLNRFEISKASTLANTERFYQSLRTAFMVNPLQERLFQAFDLNLNKEDRDETSALNSIVLFSVVLTIGGLVLATAQVLPEQAFGLIVGGSIFLGTLIIVKWSMTATVIKYWFGYRNRATTTARKRGRK